MEKDKKNKILTGVSLMPENEFISASLPLFANEEIEIIEWSFDTITDENKKPIWLNQLLNEFGNNNRLLGHGVYFSVFDPCWGLRQTNWLKQLKKECISRKYRHITEHFGFMTSNNAHNAFPLPVNLNQDTLQIGWDRLKRVQDAVELPIGIENLAFSFSEKDVKEQADFITKLIEPINGFILLDLHNIYCQAHNFNINFVELITAYPLDKVREIHISGGSWQNSLYAKDKKIRRDTHDNQVPEIIFEILPEIIRKCNNLEFIILEQLGTSLGTLDAQIIYQNDFIRLKKIVSNHAYSSSKKNNFLPIQHTLDTPPLTNLQLFEEQKTILDLIKNQTNFEIIKKIPLNNWNTSEWNIEMIHTAREIYTKWNN